MQDSAPNLADAGHFPKPELNPLLNPLLEQNLGRWAQVYFTSPPEMREAAVSDLLRELQGQPFDAVLPPSDRAPSAEGRVDLPAARVYCSACDSENRPQQRFCGFCGTPLGRGEPGRAEPGMGRRAPAGVPYSAVPAENQSAMPETLSILGLSSERSESDRRFLREKPFGSDFYEAESSSHGGRYLIAALLVALVVVATIKWPFLRSQLQTALARVVPAPSVEVSAPPRENAAPRRAESTAPPSTAEVPVPPAAAPPEARPAPPPVAAENSATIKDSRERVADRPIPGRASRASVVTLASDASASRSAVDGSQEVLLAERYLQGKGTTADHAAAARWLWKAVGKQNPRAALLLADLYAQGDGVPKSCDQARILLVVAASKGVSEAGGRLRNLESNGCR